MARYKGPKVKRFLEVIYKEAKGSSVRAAEIAGYADPVIAGPRLRRRYSDLVEAARLAWAETAHMGEDEALERLANVARDVAHKDHVRAINMILELHRGGKTDPAEIRKEVLTLIKEMSARRTLTAPAADAITVEAQVQPVALQSR